MSVKKFAVRAGLVAAASTTVLATLAGPAAAHDVQKFLYSGGMTCCTLAEANVKNSHTLITICDRAADNIGVYVEFYFYNGRWDITDYATVSDGNGSASGCGGYTVPSGYQITKFKIHDRNGKASAWFTA
ncbi:hypothetical protein [Longispora albida]|uniref:hypothetical protein n=1 Tax=Longispora albida TaxID=203523 RepID=UPI00037C01BF|nr:hypothetical protein [Longispora albida]